MFVEIFTKETTSSVLVGVVVAVIVTILLYFRKYRKFPPGPYGLPIVGYLPFMTRNPHLRLTELKKKYGPVYSIKLGRENVVMLCDYRIIKSVFNDENAMGRPPDGFFEMSKETIDLGAIHHLGWKDQRRYALHMLRDLGFGKSRMEMYVREEIEELMQRFEAELGKPISTVKYLSPSASNNIASFIFGKRRRFDDPKRIMLDHLFEESRRFVGLSIFLSFFTFLRPLARLLDIGNQGKLQGIEKQMQQYVREEIEDHKATFDPNHVRDFIDGYLIEIEKFEKDPTSSFKQPVLEDVVGLLFGAGSEATRMTIEWLLLIAASFPDVQDRIQSEIDSVIGSERFPSRADHTKMPFTEAVILETYRWKTSLPINLPRYTLEDIELNSYIIPKNTQIIAVFWALNHDPELWGKDVAEFNPQRFLSKDGKQVRKPEYLMPFSSGKRACPGEALANVAVFMYFIAILQKFRVSIPKGEKIDLTGRLVFGLEAVPHKLCFELRKASH